MKTKYITTIVLLIILFINIPILATAGQWSASGSIIYYNDGDIGIGTSTPTTKLQIKNSTSGLNFAIRNDADSADLKIITSYDDSLSINRTNVMLQTGGGDALSFGTNNTNDVRMFIGQDGNVGIGNNSPTAKLSITGSNTASPIDSLRLGTTITRDWVFTNGEYGNTTTGDYSLTLAQPGYSTCSTCKGDLVFTPGRNLIITQGNVGIGTYSPDYKLSVKGRIKAKEINVTTSGWADYVFEESYNLKPLNEVELYVKQNKHLPNIPNSKEIEEKGISVGEMQQKQMEKIEELTLYIIDLQKQIDELKSQLNNY